jgi:hypothetical protein
MVCSSLPLSRRRRFGPARSTGFALVDRYANADADENRRVDHPGPARERRLPGATYGQSDYFEPPDSLPVLIASGEGYYLPTLGERSVSGGRFTFYAGTICGNAICLVSPAATK